MCSKICSEPLFMERASQRSKRFAYAALPFFARSMASQTRIGVAGMSIASTPSGFSASITALMTAGGAPMVPRPFATRAARQTELDSQPLPPRPHRRAAEFSKVDKCENRPTNSSQL